MNIIDSIRRGDKEDIAKCVEFGRSLNVVYDRYFIQVGSGLLEREDRSPIDVAIESIRGEEQYDFVVFLLRHGANPTAVNPEAAGSMTPQTARLLIRLGVKPHGQWLFTYNAALVKFVLEEKYLTTAEINLNTKGGKTPLQYAVEMQYWDVAELLRSHGGK